MRMKSTFILLLLMSGLAAHSFAAERYGIVVGGVTVTSDNASNIADGSSVNLRGNISYDPITNTLTLHDATIEIIEPDDDSSNIDYGIHVDCDELNICLKGHNVVFGPLIGIMAKNITFLGQGFLDVGGQGDGMMANSIDVTDGCSVSCESVNICLSTRNLVVDGSTLTLMNPGASTLQEFTDLQRVELAGCDIIAPTTGVYYHSDLHTLTDDGNIQGNGVIGPVATGIRDIAIGNHHCSDAVYTTGGHRVATPERGIYINNGKLIFNP